LSAINRSACSSVDINPSAFPFGGNIPIGALFIGWASPSGRQMWYSGAIPNGITAGG